MTEAGSGARTSARWSGALACAVLVAAVTYVAAPLGRGAVTADASSFVSLVPARVLETRSGLSTVDNQFNGIGLRAAGSITALTVAGRAGVAGDAKAVIANVAVTGSSDPGFLTIFPCGQERPNAASLNHSAGQTISNAVTAQIGVGGQICIFTLAATHVIIDVTGAYPATSGFQGVVPARLLETRPGMGTTDGQFAGIGLRGAGSVTELVVRNRAGAGTAEAVVLNVAVTESAAAGFVTVFPCNEARPNAASLNYDAGQTISNAVTAKVSPGGTICVYVLTATHVIIDLTGVHPTGSGLTSLVPARLLETRLGLSTVDNQSNGIGMRGAGSVTELVVNGRGGVTTADAVVLNVAVTGSGADGYLTVFPCGGTRPTAASLNFAARQTISNAVTAKTSPDGRICIFVFAATHVVVDVTGFFPGAAIVDPNPTTTAPGTTSTTPTTTAPPGDKAKFVIVYAYPSEGRPAGRDGFEAKLTQEVQTAVNWYGTQIVNGRRPDFVTGAGGIEVIPMQLMSNRAALATEQGFEDRGGPEVLARLPANRFPLIFYDSTIPDSSCGITYERFMLIPIPNCGGNGEPLGQAWPFGATYLIAHELAHALGAVVDCAPHEVFGGHVGDSPADLLWAGNAPRDWDRLTLDVGQDDYYNPNPAALCGGGNILNSPLLTP